MSTWNQYYQKWYSEISSSRPARKATRLAACMKGMIQYNKYLKIETKVNIYKTVVRPIQSRRRQEDNIRLDFKEIGINTRNWVDSAQDKGYWRALMNAALNLRVP